MTDWLGWQWLLLNMAAAGVLVGAYRRWALRARWLAVPNHRSSHRQSTPHGAGVILLLLYAVMLCLGYWQANWPWLLLLCLSCPLLAGALGWLDDHRPLSSWLRLLAYLLIVLLLVYGHYPLPFIELGVWQMQSQWLLLSLFVLGLLWLINLYNFMDGINGIAGMELLFVLGGMYWLQAGAVEQPLLWLSTMGATTGFLLWNFPAGKVFLGDAGSIFLGSVLGLFILQGVQQDANQLWQWLILLAVFVTDSSYTLIVRFVTGQAVTQAHRSHAYQIIARHWGSHSKAVAALLAVNLFWLLPLAWWAGMADGYAFLLAAVAYLPLVLLCRAAGAGRIN